MRVGGRNCADPVALSGGIGAVGRRRGGVGWRVGGGRVVNVCGRDGVRGCGGHCACGRQRGGVHLLGLRSCRLRLIMAIAAESAVAILSIEDTLLIKEVLALVGREARV